MAKKFTIEEVEAHNKESDIYIIVHDKVYDVTNFLDEHPGGKKILLKVAGTDATKQFDNFHNISVLEKYGPQLYVGDIVNGTTSSAEENDVTSDAVEGPFGDMTPFGDPYWYQDFDGPYYNNSHRRLRAAMRKFVDTELMSHAFEWDEAKKVPKEIILKAGKAGILAGVIGNKWPTEYAEYAPPGGIKPEEFDGFHELIIFDELARSGSEGLVGGLVGGLSIGLPPITKYGTPEMKRKIFPDILSGRKTICLAITEPSAGSDVANITTEARLTDDGKYYIVNGEKKWITGGAFADYFSVAVRTGGLGMGGISLLLISREMPGVKTRQMNCTGVWASGTAYVTFEDVRVPRENIIGKVNAGFKCIMDCFNHERMIIVMQCVRCARVCYEEAMKYAHKRKTFNTKLINHPVIRNKFAHMARQIEATHSWMEALIYQMGQIHGIEAATRIGGPIALLKVQSTQTFEFCAREASQIFGGLAYTRGGQGEKVERLYREARGMAILGGSEEIMCDLGIRQSLKVAQSYGAKL